jgi:hypothetical protein
MRRAAVLLLFLCAGCLWRSYATILTVHVDVLMSTAEKLVSVVESGRGLTTEGMAEYVYPAQRGREFLRQFTSYKDRHSYQQFGVFLDHYEAFVKEADATRARGQGWQEALPHLVADRDALVPMAADIRKALQAGN